MRCDIPSVLLRFVLFCFIMMRCEMFSVSLYCVGYHVLFCYALLCCTVTMRCEMPSVFLRVVSFRFIVLWCDVCLLFCCFVLLYCVLIFCSVLFCFIVLCYGAYDSSPISSITTNEFSVACVRMWAVSSISDINVDWCWTRLSLAPMRANTRSTIPVNHVKGNIFVSKHMILIALTNYWADNATFKK